VPCKFKNYGTTTRSYKYAAGNKIQSRQGRQGFSKSEEPRLKEFKRKLYGGLFLPWPYHVMQKHGGRW